MAHQGDVDLGAEARVAVEGSFNCCEASVCAQRGSENEVLDHTGVVRANRLPGRDAQCMISHARFGDSKWNSKSGTSPL